MKFSTLKILIVFLVTSIAGVSCKKTESLIDFTEEDEILLGEKLAIAFSEDADYNLISSEGNTIPYGYVNSRLNEIIASSVLTKGESFTWTITLVEDDRRQAFAFPGGYLYVSTGMIFYLNNEDEFSGLLAHLIAHIDQSHITETLFFKYGVNGLKSIASSGDSESLKSIIEDLELSGDYLQISRANELQADTLTVSLLTGTGQSCEASGLIIERILTVQPNQLTGFIGAHRLEEDRVVAIKEKASGCDTAIDGESAARYRSFRNSLP
ncbi:M48 family metallopeptidase [Ekhidna sp.]|uniref:M48 family metallopeptidase n=1 Tax=Ekhidna sp. TaxID=2608089 RepID=UPI0032EA9E23